MAIPTLTNSFTYQLEHIVCTGMAADMAFELKHVAQNKTLLQETYTPDSAGNITLRGLNTVLEAYLQDELADSALLIPCLQNHAEFSFSFDGVAQVITVYYSPADLGYAFTAFAPNYFLSILDGAKRTRMDSVEELFWFGEAADEVKIVAQYLDDETQALQYAEANGTKQNLVNSLYYAEVSPSKLLVAGKTLIMYQVQVGNRVRMYKIDYNSYFNMQQLVFINNFGIPETCYFIGERTVTAENERTLLNFADGTYGAAHVQAINTYTLDTGVLTPAEADWLVELAYSLTVYLYENKTLGRKITITEDDMPRSSLPTELPRFTFTYRLAKQNARVVKLGVRTRVFDDKFVIIFG